MPESRKERPVNISTGDLSVSLEAATAGTMVPDFGQIASDTTEVIPAGAYNMTVYNVGNEDITVNGQKILPGDDVPFVSVYNQTNNRRDFVPEITVVVPVDGAAYYSGFYPSA
jgi:hypothetical protein